MSLPHRKTASWRVHEEALRIRRSLGDNHPDVSVSLSNIADTHRQLGQFELALRGFEESLRIKKAALGPDHHAVSTTLNNIGNLYKVCAGCGCFAVEQADKLSEWAPGCPFFGLVPCGEER